MNKSERLYCCGCQEKVDAVLVTGKEIYPHREDLQSIPFWQCPTCGLYVGCHHKTSRPTTPLGCIPTKEMKSARGYVHALIDPLWKMGFIKRKRLYRRMGEILQLSGEYHTGGTRSIDELRRAYRAGLQIKRELGV